MSPEILALIYAIGLGVGWLVGAVGVGGVLLVPALVLLGGLSVEAATPVASLSFLFTGAAGTLTYAMSRRLQRPIVVWLSVGAVPGAVAGAATNVAVSPRLITVAVALVLVAAALRALRRSQATQDERSTALSASAYVTIGAGVGFGSALTGTGGPVLLIPVLMLAGGAAVTAVAASQPIQIPIAIAATAGFLALGEIDWPLGIGLGLTQAIGAIAGARFSHQAPARTLRRLVSLTLIIAAAIFVGKAVAG